jgi:hypothetical protein
MIMTERRISRWMGPVGLAILVLLVVGFAVLGGNQPKENVSGSAVDAYSNAHQAQEWAQVYVIGLALALMVFYVSHLRGVLIGKSQGTNEGDGNRTLANASFAGGILFVVGLMTAGTLAVAQILATHNHQADIAHTLNFVGQNAELGYLFGMAVFALATGAAILGQAGLPRWLGWAGIVVGVICVAGPISFLGLILGAIWIAITGFVVAARSKDSSRGLDAAATSPAAIGS